MTYSVSSRPTQMNASALRTSSRYVISSARHRPVEGQFHDVPQELERYLHSDSTPRPVARGYPECERHSIITPSRSTATTRLPGFHELTRSTATTNEVADARELVHAQQPPLPSSRGQVRLSVYESPRATYTWPRFDPTSMPSSAEPVIYVTYKHAPDALCPSTSSGSETESSYAPSVCAEDQRVMYGRKRSSSIESEYSQTPPVGRFLKQQKISHAHNPSYGISVPLRGDTSHAADFSRSVAQRAEKDLQANFRELDIEPNHSEDQSTARDHPEQAQADAGDDWVKYAKPLKSPDSAKYSCSWRVRGNYGDAIDCGYTSKRHLVKRHIESKHLQLRPCICAICGKGFSQKSNLETHLNTHTGAAPHKCQYCDETFKDPARRHRHMKAMHKHVSSRTRKNGMEVAGSTPEVTEPESEE